MSTPVYKVYDAAGKYRAAVDEAEGAAVLANFFGTGATVRYSHSWIVWKEGAEATTSAESIDDAAITIRNRVAERHNARDASRRGRYNL